MALEQNIELSDGWFIGEDKVFRFKIYGEDGVTPKDISGWTFRADWRTSPGAIDPPLISKITPTQITITSAVEGEGQIAVTDADTDNLDPGRLHYALKRTNDGAEAVVIYGYAILQESSVR